MQFLGLLGGATREKMSGKRLKRKSRARTEEKEARLHQRLKQRGSFRWAEIWEELWLARWKDFFYEQETYLKRRLKEASGTLKEIASKSATEPPKEVPSNRFQIPGVRCSEF